jgi:hypothetical protein
MNPRMAYTHVEDEISLIWNWRELDKVINCKGKGAT